MLLLSPVDYEQMGAWIALIQVEAGPWAARAAPFRIGIKAAQVEKESDELAFTDFQGLGMSFANVRMCPAPPGTALAGPQHAVPLWVLELPAGVSVIPVYSSADFAKAMALVASDGFQARAAAEYRRHARIIEAAYPAPQHCALVQLLVNISLPALAWPAAGVPITCSVLLQGLPHSMAGEGVSIDLGLSNATTFLRMEGAGSIALK